MANASESSLMKRTKVELIQIILRKDQTEAEQAKTIKELNAYIENYKKTIHDLSSKYSELESEVDDLTSLIEDKDIIMSKWKFTAITAIGVAVLCGLLLLV